MKKSELKEIIRTSLLEEMEYDEPSTYTDKDLDDLLSIVLKYVEDPNDAEKEIEKFDAGGFDAMSSSLTANLLRDKDYNDWYNKLHSIKEEEEEDVEVEDEVEITADEKEGIDVKQDVESDLTGIVGDVQDNLEAALEASRKLGDEKLVDQIGNTITFFTRAHVVGKSEVEEGVLNENKEEARYELEEIMDQLYRLSDQAKMIFKNHFPAEYSRLNAYGALDFGTSSNRYDVTLEGTLENLDMEDDDDVNIDEAVTNVKVGDLVAHDKTGERFKVISVPSKTKIIGKNRKGEEKTLSKHHVTMIEVGMKLEESVNRMKKLAGIIK